MRERSRRVTPIGTLRTLAMLLDYPDAELRTSLVSMREILHRENALLPARLTELDALIEWLGRTDPFEVESNYVALFDRGRATSLHLFEHVHGDSRARGPAMIDLAQTYEKAGLYLIEGELPDYLPAVLEFVSTQPLREARAFLSEMAHLFNIICNALRQRQSAYASVLGALLELAGAQAQPVEPVADESLDDSWLEPAAFTGCSTKGQAKPGDAQPIHFVRPAPTAVGANEASATQSHKGAAI